jgi:hypothetical protein
MPRAAKGWFGVKGCLNFHDDPTHRSIVSLPRVKTLLAERGFQVERIRSRFLWRRILLLPAYLLAGLVLRGYIPASVVWDVTGFAQSLVAQRIVSGGAHRLVGDWSAGWQVSPYLDEESCRLPAGKRQREGRLP